MIINILYNTNANILNINHQLIIIVNDFYYDDILRY